MAYNSRDCFWFGTEHRAGWFRTPMKGAEGNSEGWSSGGSLLNGGGYQFESWGSHKVFQYEWGSATPVEFAQRMKAYFDGTYGRGLLYFYDPFSMPRNAAPARWADPSMALNFEGSGLVYGVDPTEITTPANTNDYPIAGAAYDLTNIAAGWRGREDAVYFPIPDGYTILLGAAYTATGSAGVFVRESDSGTLGASTLVTPLAVDDVEIMNTYVSGSSGIWLYVGKSASGASTINLYGITVRVVPTTSLAGVGGGYGDGFYGEFTYGASTSGIGITLNGPWSAGMGHSGCRPIGKPTYSITGPLNGGQVGFAASFREVGDFSYA